MTRIALSLVAILALALAACTPQAAEPEQVTKPAPGPTVAPTPSVEAKPAGDAPGDQLAVAEGQAKLTLAIEGLHCGGCAAGVDGRLRQVAGVADCVVDFETGRAVIVYDPTTIQTEALAAASIAGTTYTAQAVP